MYLSESWEIWLCNPTGLRLELLDRVQSFAVTKVRNGVGACVINLPADYDDFIRLDYLLEFWRRPIGGTLKHFNTYFIRRWRNDEQFETDITTSWGFDANYLLSGRIVAYDAESPQSLKTDQLDDMMRAIIRENLGSSAGAGRTLSNVGAGFTVDADLAAAPTATRAFSWTNVLATLVDLSETSRQLGTNLYFDVTPNFTSSGLIAWEFSTFIAQRGIDRTAGTNYPVFFGRQWGNLEQGYLDEDHERELNYVYGRGQGLTSSRFSGDASDSDRMNGSIWNRREGYANAAAGGGGESNSSTIAEARARLEANRPAVKAGGMLLDTGQARYDIDFTFGDAVTMEVRGKQLDAEVAVVGFTMDENSQETQDFRVEVIL